MSYQITEEQKKALLQYSAQTLPDNPSRDGFSAESIRKRMYKPTEKLIDLVNSVFDTAYTDVQSVLTDIQNGNLFARSFVSWSASYTYGADEITFYPSIGTYGAFVQSVVAGNTNNTPYVDGAINSAYWKEVVNFNTVTEEYFQQVQEAVAQAESAATEAEGSAQAAANSATTATEQAEAAAGSAGDAAQSATEAAKSATAASTSASQAAASATQSQNSANQSGTYASNAQTSAQNAADSATAAQQYAQQAQQYAQKHYQVVASVSALPRPGDSAFIYLVPTGSGTSNDSYSEYLWITESNDYEFIGTTADIDLSNYAQINGTYAGMTVGNATNAQTATNAQQLGGVAAANYAQTNGTYSGMTVGKATQADNAATATDSEKLGGVLANQYAIITGTYSGMTVGNATNATNADTANSATSAQDSAKLGGVAADQYALQSQLPVANPTATGTQDLTSLQVGGTVYNIPATAIEYMTDEEVDALFASTPPIPSFAEATWEQIAQVSEAGTAQDYFSVGDEKTISLSTGEQVTLVILGFDHDDLTGGGKAGITIGMKNLLATTYKMNSSNTNAGGWDESEMRTSTMATLLSQFPSDLQSVIKQVNKKATAGGASTSITTSADKLWLFAEVEIDGTTSAGYADEGEQYEYWKTVKDGTVADDRKKYLSNGSGSANYWWLRSPSLGYSTSFGCVNLLGGVSGYRASISHGVSFGFCV